MGNADDFVGLIKRVRLGDANAAEKLVRQYEPAVRRAIPDLDDQCPAAAFG